jgi:hypothetical protein
MTKIDLTLDLPDRLAREADEAGLLSPRALARLLREEMRREALRRITEGTERVRKAGIKPLSLAEIQREVDKVRKGE